MRRDNMDIINADINTPAEIFEQLSMLDKLCVGADGWSADSFRSEVKKITVMFSI